jgi:hypothetical protein
MTIKPIGSGFAPDQCGCGAIFSSRGSRDGNQTHGFGSGSGLGFALDICRC